MVEPPRRTEPSSTWVAPSSRWMRGIDFSAPRNWKLEARPDHLQAAALGERVQDVLGDALGKKVSSGSGDRLRNGTAASSGPSSAARGCCGGAAFAAPDAA
jgi:hypothetical protein